MEIKIIFEDEDILALNKPSGITVNKADTTRGEETVQDFLEERFKIYDLRFKNNEEEADFYNRAGPPATHAFALRAGIVHRLDKETSGILLIAKNPDSFVKLQRQFKERIVKKTYVALVHGKVEPPEGEIRVPVGRLPWNRKQFGVIAGGREAVTKYKVLRYYACHPDQAKPGSGSYALESKMLKQVQYDNNLSFLEIYPETGRTHQIRVHLKYIGHPIFADFLYAGRKTARNDRKFLSRVFLHASKISFLHSKTNKQMSFEAPLPKELEDFLSKVS